jgi:O-antigen ligase
VPPAVPEYPPESAWTRLHDTCDRATGWLLGAMLVFTPWAFGTTQPWSIRWMNWAAYALGTALIIKLVARRLAAAARKPVPASALALFFLTAGLLAWCFISAANAASVYVPREFRLEAVKHIAWLPHSLDGPASWSAFWRFLALACAFWATLDWLGQSRLPREDLPVPRAPSRLRLLLWITAINAALLALEGMIQRTSGTAELLWLVPTRENKDALSQFGPYAYRSNAAQYLNLVWPAALGFWWWLHRDRTQSVTRRQLHHVLVPCVIITATAGLFSLSRAGAGVTALMLGGAVCLTLAQRSLSWKLRLGVVVVAALVALAAAFTAWTALAGRIAEFRRDPSGGRAETYALAERMARDYPWFGTGPGTFDSIFQIYRQSPDQYWPAQLHNDWQEFRITFGRIGFAMMLAGLGLILARWFCTRSGTWRDATFLALMTIALCGCLLHARFDFPFQVYSVTFYFVVFAAVLFSSRRA